MTAWTRGNAKNAFVRQGLVLAAATAGAALLPAAPAQAVVGVGNAVFGNSCANEGSGVRAQGPTVSGSGLLGGNVGQLPLDLPRNQCGNSGIDCAGWEF